MAAMLVPKLVQYGFQWCISWFSRTWQSLTNFKLVAENHIIYLMCALVWYPLTQIVCPLAAVDIHSPQRQL